ncbi:MAG: GNVR domain-containing protein [Anaerolineae bacterium]
MNRLVKYLAVVLKWRKFIFWNTFVLALVAAGISLVLPQRFTAAAQLLPPTSDADPFGLTSILGGGMGGSSLSRLRSSVLGSSASSELVIGILTSATIVGKVSERCSIAAYYRIRRASSEKAARKLLRLTTISAGDEGIVRVSVEAKTRHLAAKIANSYVAELDTFLRCSNMSRGRNMRVFLERRLLEVEGNLAVAQESLSSFQRLHKVVAVDEETKAAIESYARLRSQLLVKEAELGAAEAVSGEDNPLARNLRREIDNFRRQVGELESGKSSLGYGVGFGVPFSELPRVSGDFASRYRDYRILGEAYAALYQQYEYARVLEARDAPAITVLDHAGPPERRSFPRRSLIVLAAFLSGAIVSSAIAFLIEYARLVIVPGSDGYVDLQAVKAQLARMVSALRVYRRSPKDL